MGNFIAEVEKLQFYKEKLLDLKYYQIVGISTDDCLSILTLEFTNGVSERDIIIQFTKVAGFSITKDAEDDEGCFPVLEVSIDYLEKADENTILLPKCSIDLIKPKATHFSVDGGARVEVIFYDLHIFQPQNFES